MNALVLAVVLAGASGAALAAEPPCARHITVTGRASATQAPDFAEIAIGIEAKGADPASAVDSASKAVAGVVALAKEAGLSPSEIGTAAVTLQPATRPVNRPGGVTEEPDGYAASNIVRLRVAAMDRLGEILRKALSSGVNRIDGISFGLRDPEAAQAALQVAAAKDARTRAAALAEATGAKLGPLCTLTALDQGGTPFPMRAMAASVAKARAVPVEAGTVESQAAVSAQFALEP